MKYRSRNDIMCQILEAANGGTTKTKIMYQAFLSYAQLKEYLSTLIENDLLYYVEGARKYKTTEKGKSYQTIYGQLNIMTAKPSELSN